MGIQQPKRSVSILILSDPSLWPRITYSIIAVSNTAAKQPRLFTFSSRTQEGLDNVLDLVQKEQPDNMEMQALLQEMSDTSSTAHPYRGYAILNHEGNVKDVQVFIYWLWKLMSINCGQIGPKYLYELALCSCYCPFCREQAQTADQFGSCLLVWVLSCMVWGVILCSWRYSSNLLWDQMQFFASMTWSCTTCWWLEIKAHSIKRLTHLAALLPCR